MNLPHVISLDISSIYIALCGILLVFLAITVVRSRLKNQVGIGDGGVSQLNRLIRTHGNSTEYIPIALLSLVAVESTGTADWLVHALGSLLIVGRLLHAAGLSKSAGTSVPSVSGTICTMVMILTSSVILLINAF